VARSVLTVSREVVPVAVAAARVERRGRPVVLGQMTLNDLDTFLPIDAVKLPDAPAYLAVEVDLGAGSRNVRPEDALRDIEVGRSPLRRGHRSRTPAARGDRPQLGVLDGGVPARRPTRSGVLAQRGPAEARLVLGPEPSHLARHRLVLVAHRAGA
jgi:hypothetical protein